MSQVDTHSASVAVVALRRHLVTALLQELPLHGDLLAQSVAAEGLVGSVEDLAEIARRLETVAGVAAAVGQAKRAERLRKVVAAVESHIGSEEQPQRRGVPLSEVPRQKPMHHAKVKRYERRLDALSEDDLDSADAGFDVEFLHRGRANGREATKRAFGTKSRPRASKERGMIRGDKMFWHNEAAMRTDGVVWSRVDSAEAMLVTPNDERSAWLVAGSGDGDRMKALELTRAGRKVRAKAGSQEPLIQRVERAARAVARKNGKVRPSWIAYELEREDLLAKRYPLRGARHKQAHAKYVKAAQAFLASSAPVVEVVSASPTAERAARRAERTRVIPFKACDHEWRVSPKRTRRTCECCARVERKVRGRWQLVVAAAKKVERSRKQDEAAVRRMMSLLSISREEAVQKVKRLAQFA